jgi:hypothetical protein
VDCGGCVEADPMEYRMDRKPDWKVFLNMAKEEGGGREERMRSE